ncbi:glycoside hydrolase family 38 C-terminal domain-containing protein [Actinoplanes solisilvae]|uniref:glycoside hydrolase family 38 N-terminal domain-containing protein n=1 Tax=Actinoplanes solisilvae TaxID=2486853 RepID=UPI000FD98DCF|nr:glycoside hydrolase family 38 C-terminal domain-containing protein [Actinoplanes solisilvae]
MIVLVPHTHWDREWYEPFQVFRHRLVDALDQVLELAEAEPGFRFTLDGQTAAIEDYLEIRPENTERVRAAVRRGQLALGPWLILLDEFLCSGETIVRNLQLGWAGAQKLGGAMPIGYLPDMFGHVAQMPQILARAGLGHAALWRGVPAEIDGHAFRWTAPDGSSVRTEYLFDGYGNALDVLLVPDQIPRALGDYHELTRKRWGADPILGMVGTDHMAPRADLMDLVRRFSTPERPITVATLDEYVSALAGVAELPEVRGELRSHARANILPGVLSVRRGLKDAMAAAERVLDEAERLTVDVPLDRTLPFLEKAWRKVVESSAHDSVVGSGTDETVTQVAARLAEAAQLGRAVRDAALAGLARDVPADAVLAVNPRTTAATVFVETEVAALDGDAVLADGRRLPVQELGRTPAELGDETWAAADVERVLRRIHRRELFGQEIDRYEITPGSLTFHVARVPTMPEFDLLALRGELRRAVAAHPGPWRVRTIAEPRRRVLVAVPVGPSGRTAVRLVPGESAPAPGILHATESELSNGLISAKLLPDGTLEVHGSDGTVLSGVGRLVDGGDRGDSYNYGPPAADTLVDVPEAVEVRVLETGPLRAAVEITRVYRLPAGLADDPDHRRAETLDMPVRTRVEVRAGEPFVRLSVSFVNVVADHRLRLHVPLSGPVGGSAAEGQFAVTERGVAAEGGWGEFPLPTYPAYGFVAAGDATVLLTGATEYELVADGGELALTLLRAVGAMSVNLHPLRDEPAASEIPIPGGQELGGEFTVDLAVLPATGGWAAADAVRRSEEFRSPGLWQAGLGPIGGPLPADVCGLAVDGEGVSVTAVRRTDSGVELRLVAMTPAPTTAKITGPYASASEADLLGRTTGSSVDAAHVALGPWEIRTLHLR